MGDIKDRRERSEQRLAHSMSEHELYWTHRLRSGGLSHDDQAPIIGIQPRASSPEPDDPPPREAKLRIRLQGPLPMLDASVADKCLQAGSIPSRLGSARRSTSLATKPWR